MLADGIGVVGRKARHLAAADYMSGASDDSGDLAMVIAQHLMEAVDASSTGESDVAELTARARELLMRAGDRAVALGSPAEGLELYLTALERATDARARATVLLPAVKAALCSGRSEKAVELAHLAVELLDAEERTIEAGIAGGLMGEALVNLGDNAAAIAIAEPRWAELEEVKDYEALSHALIVKGILYVTDGAPITARGLYEAAAGIAREHNLTGRLAEASTLVDETLERVTQVSMRVALMVVKGGLADALGEPAPLVVDEPTTDSISDRSWVAAQRIQAAWADGNTAMAAQFHRFSALVGAARGDDSLVVEAEFRIGIDALTTFGAKGIAAQAREELGSWLIEQDRAAEAVLPLEQARATYAEIGAVGWLQRLEARHLEEAGTHL